MTARLHRFGDAASFQPSHTLSFELAPSRVPASWGAA